MNLLEQQNLTIVADTIARNAHLGQTRNDKRTPYYTHPLAVEAISVEILKQHRVFAETIYPQYSFEILVEFLRQITKMHDVVEDTDVDIFDIMSYGFHEIVVTGVSAITKNPTKGAETYLDYLKRVHAHLLARIAKQGDLKHNMSDLKPGNMLDKYVLADHFLAF